MAVNGSLPRIVGADVEKESGAEEGASSRLTSASAPGGGRVDQSGN